MFNPDDGGNPYILDLSDFHHDIINDKHLFHSENGGTLVMCYIHTKEDAIPLIQSMKMIGVHINIVNYLNFTITPNGKFGLCFEFCPFGSLEGFISRNNEKFLNQIDSESGNLSADKQKIYQECHEIYSQSDYFLSTRKLILFIYQASKGMDFLHKNQVNIQIV